MTDVTIRHNPEWNRFEVRSGDDVIGKAAYLDYDGGSAPQRIFYHTVKHPEYAASAVPVTPAHMELLTAALAARA